MARNTTGDDAYQAMLYSRETRDNALKGITDPRERDRINRRHGKSVQRLMKEHAKMMRSGK